MGEGTLSAGKGIILEENPLAEGSPGDGEEVEIQPDIHTQGRV